MNFKHNTEEIKGISRLASAISSDDLKKVGKEIRKCLKFISREKIYETILQSYLFCGFPAIIETLRLFQENSRGYTKGSEEYDVKGFKQRGMENCRRIYGKNFERLMENMEILSPDLKQWMIIEGYGKVMGRDGLNLLEREFVNVSILCTRFYSNQLHSHLKGCLHNGAKYSEIEEVIRGLKGIAGSRNISATLSLLMSFKAK
jgi:alkylhydroperoxidase/carboxymuconolactone decarboxylase family protein YurZ